MKFPVDAWLQRPRHMRTPLPRHAAHQPRNDIPPRGRSRGTEMSHKQAPQTPEPTPTPCTALKCPNPRGAEAHCAEAAA